MIKEILQITELEVVIKEFNDIVEQHSEDFGKNRGNSYLDEGMSKAVDGISKQISILRAVMLIDNVPLTEVEGVITECMRMEYLLETKDILGCGIKFAMSMMALVVNVEALIKQAARQVQTEDKTIKHDEEQEIPTIRKTEQEKSVFKKAIEKGYMVQDGDCYKWNETKSLLAYLCGRLYCGDRIKEDSIDYSRELIKGNTQLPRTDLKRLFGADVGANRGVMQDHQETYIR